MITLFIYFRKRSSYTLYEMDFGGWFVLLIYDFIFAMGTLLSVLGVMSLIKYLFG